MERTLIKDLKDSVGETVTIKGWISVRRDQGKMVFFDIRDRSGTVQGVVLPKSEAIETAKNTTLESSVAITGVVNTRPEKNIVEGKQNGDIELQIENIEILNASQTLPFDLSADVGLDVHLDYRPLLLKTERDRDIFALQATILNEYRKALLKREFVEFN